MRYPEIHVHRAVIGVLLLAAVFVLSGCGLFGGQEAEPTPTATRRMVPTFTPTSVGQAPAQSQVVQVATSTPLPEPATPTPAPAEPTPTDTPVPAPRLTVTGTVANVRQGPGTNYPVIGSVTQGTNLDVTGKNPAGDWYQVCCVNGEPGWIFADLVQVENPELAAVVQDIPAPPPTPTPLPPTPTDTPAPPPVADPCANIGGDGCKFKLTGGPRFRDNGGLELKLQIFFIHSGVDGGQPQGSYFVALEKDGIRIPVSDRVRSVALQRSEGPLGPYNYEYKIGRDQLPGGTVAGTYVLWVLDGNGERDSQNITFTVPEGQGEVWLQFDQN